MSEEVAEQKVFKVWKRAGVFPTYEVAVKKKTELLSEWNDKLLVKIKRYGQNYEKFQVKYWHPDFAKRKKINKTRKKNHE